MACPAPGAPSAPRRRAAPRPARPGSACARRLGDGPGNRSRLQRGAACAGTCLFSRDPLSKPRHRRGASADIARLAGILAGRGSRATGSRTGGFLCPPKGLAGEERSALISRRSGLPRPRRGPGCRRLAPAEPAEAPGDQEEDDDHARRQPDLHPSVPPIHDRSLHPTDTLARLARAGGHAGADRTPPAIIYSGDPLTPDEPRAAAVVGPRPLGVTRRGRR
jgi:hypothetical protein